jgi:hypothetical protein
VVATAGVVGLQPALELGVEVGQASEVLAVEGRPVELLERGPLEALADRVVVGRPGRDAVLADAELLEVAGERLPVNAGPLSVRTPVSSVPMPVSLPTQKVSRATRSPGRAATWQNPNGPSLAGVVRMPVVAAVSWARAATRWACRPSW